MLFDLRSGRRRNVIKVVYATLAVLMGLSLFLVIGGFNIAELFNSPGTGDAAAQYEDDAERIEGKLRKDPEDPALLLSLTRARINAASARFEIGPGEQRLVTPEAEQQQRLAADAWEKYLEATDEPAVMGAQLMAPTLITLAESSRTNVESNEFLQAAVEAARIVAEKRPNLNSLSTLAFYTALFEPGKADEVAAEAKKYATNKFTRQSFERQLNRLVKFGGEFQSTVRAEEQQQASTGAGRQSLENPLGGAGLGGATLGN